METTVIHLLRHGEVDNPDGVVYGRLPHFSLTELGQQMGQTVADHLKSHDTDIAHIVSSPLLRAQQTALPTALAYDLEIATDANLIEAASHFEGVAVNENRWQLAHPKNWKYYAKLHQPGWGEPYAEILARMQKAIASALAKAKGREALLVSHQLPIVMVQRFLEGQPLSHSPLSRSCSLASLTSLTFEGDRLRGWQYSEPAGDLLAQARDMNPGASQAQTR